MTGWTEGMSSGEPEDAVMPYPPGSVPAREAWLLDRLEELQKERDKAQADLQVCRQSSSGTHIRANWQARAEAAESKLATAREALEAVQRFQPKRMEWYRDEGIVFDEKPHKPLLGDWQAIAFWTYTDLCEVESIASGALAALGENQ